MKIPLHLILIYFLCRIHPRPTMSDEVFCGEPDKKAAIKIAEKLSRAKFSTIENSGHEVNIDNPNGLAKAIEALNVD